MNDTTHDRTLVPVGEPAPTLPAVQLATLPVEAVVARMQRIQEIKDAVMKGPVYALDARGNPKKDSFGNPIVTAPGVHYDIIKGCKKPSLLQPGAEILLTTFRLGARHEIQDLSVPGVVRYRVRCIIYDQQTGVALGDEWGEASSEEEKYAWRRAVCKEEFDATDPALRRLKWSAGYQDKPAKSTQQVKTNPADVANTILAMASKRAKVRAARAATAASDTFDINLEDLPEELREAASESSEVSEEQRQRFAEQTRQRDTRTQARERDMQYGALDLPLDPKTLTPEQLAAGQTVLPAGKHKGEKLIEQTAGYLHWLIGPEGTKNEMMRQITRILLGLEPPPPVTSTPAPAEPVDAEYHPIDEPEGDLPENITDPFADE